MRALVLSLVLTALFAAPANASLTAAAFARAGDPSAECLRSTGTPGEVALQGLGGVDLWTTSIDGAARAARVPVPRQATCAEFATAADGTTALAVAQRVSRSDPRQRILVATRPRGGSFGPLVAVARAATPQIGLALAVGARGDVAIAWMEERISRLGTTRGVAVRVVRRPAGGGFGAPATLFDGRGHAADLGLGAVAAGVDASGATTVAWAANDGRARVAAAPAGAPFGAPVRLSGDSPIDYSVALAVAPDGRALLGTIDTSGFRLAERAPGRPSFAPVDLPADARNGAEAMAVAIDPAGGGLVAWQSLFGRVSAAWRPAPGPFGSVHTLARGRDDTGFDEGFAAITIGGIAESTPAPVTAAVGRDGRAVVGWFSRDRATHVGVATGDLDGDLTAQRLGSPVRDVHSVAPGFTADGNAQLAWTDAALSRDGVSLTAGRLHVALPAGRPAAARPAPGLVLRAPRRARLYATQSLRVTVRCSAACDLRVSGGGAVVTRTLARARTMTLGLERPRPDGRPAGPMVVRARATAPDGTVVRIRRRVTVIRRRPAPPLPRVLDLRAHRDGKRIVVTFRTDITARRVVFLALLSERRRITFGSALGYGQSPGRGRRRHRVVIRRFTAPRALRRARYLHLYVGPLDRNNDPPPVTVRVH